MNWRDPESAWQVKLDRAAEHINSLAAAVAEFAPAATYTAVPEPGPRPGETTYILRMSQSIPVRFSPLASDGLQNMRASLGCAAYGIAERNL